MERQVIRMVTKEFIRKYFLHKYKSIDCEGIHYFELVNTDADFDDIQTPITENNDFLNAEDKYFYIWCEHGHLIKASLDTMEDLIENGCPFCKQSKTYDWQRHIDYSFRLDSYGHMIDSLDGYKHCKNSIIKINNTEDNVSVLASSYYVSISEKMGDNYELVESLRYSHKRGIYNTNKFIDLGEDLWRKCVYQGGCKEQKIIPFLKNCIRVYETYKASEDDIFITECEDCQGVTMSSALTINHEGLICSKCGKVLWEKQNWFNYNYSNYLDRIDYSMWLHEVIFINPKYGTKLQDLKPYLNENYIDPEEIDCSLLEWCQRPENKEIGDIVINQFAKVKNRKKLSEIRADSDDVLWLKGSKGSLFDTTVKNVVRDRKLREKLPSGTSFAELFVYYALKMCYPEVIHRYKTEDNVELDIYIPELNQGIEYNGSIYHKIKYDKTESDEAKKQYCEEHNIKLLVIEDDGEQAEGEIVDNKIVFQDSQKNRDKRLYEVCKLIYIYLFIEAELPSIERIKKDINLYY